MYVGPATVVVLFVAGVLLVLGALLLGRRRSGGVSDYTPCSTCSCGHANRAGSKFCAKCGAPLRGE